MAHVSDLFRASFRPAQVQRPLELHTEWATVPFVSRERDSAAVDSLMVERLTRLLRNGSGDDGPHARIRVCVARGQDSAERAAESVSNLKRIIFRVARIGGYGFNR